MANHEIHQLVLIDQRYIARTRKALQVLGNRLGERTAGHEHTLQTAV